MPNDAIPPGEERAHATDELAALRLRNEALNRECNERAAYGLHMRDLAAEYGKDARALRARVEALEGALRKTDALVVEHHSSRLMGATCEDGVTCLACHENNALVQFRENSLLLRGAALARPAAPEGAPDDNATRTE